MLPKTNRPDSVGHVGWEKIRKIIETDRDRQTQSREGERKERKEMRGYITYYHIQS